MTNPTTSQIIAAAREAAAQDVASIGTPYQKHPLVWYANALERITGKTNNECYCGNPMPKKGEICEYGSGCKERVEYFPPEPAPPEPEAGGEYGGSKVHNEIRERSATMSEMLSGMTNSEGKTLGEALAPTLPANIFLGHVPGAVVTRRDRKVGKYLKKTDKKTYPHRVIFDAEHEFNVTDVGKYYANEQTSGLDITHIAAAPVKGEEKYTGFTITPPTGEAEYHGHQVHQKIKEQTRQMNEALLQKKDQGWMRSELRTIGIVYCGVDVDKEDEVQGGLTEGLIYAFLEGAFDKQEHHHQEEVAQLTRDLAEAKAEVEQWKDCAQAFAKSIQPVIFTDSYTSLMSAAVIKYAQLNVTPQK